MSPVAFVQQPIRWLRAITKYRGTLGGGPNFGYDLCVSGTSEQQRAGLDLSSWEVAYTGAERVQDRTLREFEAAFAPYRFTRDVFCPCYGLAETTLLATGSSEGRTGRDGAAQCDSTAATPRGGRPAGHRQRQRNGHGRTAMPSPLMWSAAASPTAALDVRIVDPESHVPVRCGADRRDLDLRRAP